MENNIVDDFQLFYQQLNKQTLSLTALKNIYHDNVVFEDCFHNIEGITNMFAYFENLYENIGFIHFDFENQWVSEDGAMLTWKMSYQHPKLNRGHIIEVQGASHLTICDEKIIRHQDYFDGGALLYEHIPVLKRVIYFLKNRLT